MLSVKGVIHVFLFFYQMKNSNVIFFLLLFLGVSLKAEVRTLVRIGNTEVPVSEFLYYYNHASKVHEKNMQTSFDDFLRYKLKVIDAGERCMDTLPDFRRLCGALQKRVLKDYFTDNQLADSYYHRWFKEYADRRCVKEWVKMEIVTYRLPQHPTALQENNAVRVMDEFYRMLVNGETLGNVLGVFADREQLVCESDGKDWIPQNSLLQEIIDRKTMEGEGKYSQPFYSPLGLHIVRLVGQKQHISFEEALPFMKAYMNSLGSDNPSLKRELYNQWKSGRVMLPEEVTNRMQEIHDGLLALFWDSTTELSGIGNVTFQQLESYFRANKKKYEWEYPHFKGAVIHCINKKAASKIKKRLKKLPMPLWEEAVRRMAVEDSRLTAEIESGLFQIGKNAYVDRLAFKCGDFESRTDLPYTFIVGKRLKKGPEDYTDVLADVKEDYQKEHEKEFFDVLFSRFKVEINQDVLKSVNSCGNK